MDERRGRQAGGGDALADPVVIDFREETADLVPAGPLVSQFSSNDHTTPQQVLVVELVMVYKVFNIAADANRGI